jgi:hypothetical protein
VYKADRFKGTLSDIRLERERERERERESVKASVRANNRPKLTMGAVREDATTILSQCRVPEPSR